MPALAAAALALVLSACGGSGQAGPVTTGASTFDPLTVRIEPSSLDAATPPEPGVLRVTGTPSLGFGLLRVAGAERLFAAQGLAAAFAEAPDEATVARRLSRGTAHAAVVSTEQALQLAERDMPIRIVLLLTSSNADDVILARDGIEDPAGLVGLRVAYLPGGDGELLLRGALAQAGLGMDAIVPVPVSGGDPAELLAAGAAEAAVLSGEQARQAQEADATLAIAFAAGLQPGLVSRVVVVREEIAAERPGQLLALVRAWEEIYLLDRADPVVIGGRAGAIQGVDPAVAVRALEGTALYDVPQNAVELLPGGEYHDAVIGLVAELSAEAGWIAGTVDPQGLIDALFAQTAATAMMNA